MIGWLIIVAQQTPEERDSSVGGNASNLANWETSVGGVNWLEKLTKEGKATKLSSGGYPNRYVAIARDVLPLITDMPPPHTGPTIIGDDYVMHGDWIGNVVIDYNKIAACPSDQILTIDAWDQS